MCSLKSFFFLRAREETTDNTNNHGLQETKGETGLDAGLLRYLLLTV